MIPLPEPAATVTATATVTVTAAPSLAPADDSKLTDQLQGWGTVAAVVAALLIAAIGWIIVAFQRRKDQRESERQRQGDFLVQQLQAAADLYAEYKGSGREFSRFGGPQDSSSRHAERVASQRLRVYLATIPSPYASLLKVQVLGSGSADEETLREARRRAPEPNGERVDQIDDGQIYREIADNIDDILGQKGKPGWMTRVVRRSWGRR